MLCVQMEKNNRVKIKKLPPSVCLSNIENIFCLILQNERNRQSPDNLQNIRIR